MRAALRSPLLSTIAVTFSLLLSSCGSMSTPAVSSTSGSSGSGPVPAVTALAVELNGVAPNRKQEVQFSEAMNPDTINAKTFLVTDAGGNQVTGTVTYDPDFNVAAFQPSPAFESSTQYTATITTGAKSVGGMALAANYAYSFSTRADNDSSPLRVTSVTPAANAQCVGPTTGITIVFSEAPDASTLTTSNIVVTDSTGNTIPVTLSTNISTTQVVATPKSALPSGNITVKVSNVGDLAGQMMQQPFTWTFSTACNTGGGGGAPGGAEFLYMVADQQQGDVYEFQIDTSTGTFTQVQGSPFHADVGNPAVVCTQGCEAQLLADPLGRFLFYQFNYGDPSGSPTNALDSLTVNAQNGTLSSNSKVLQAVYEMSADPLGRFIYWNGSNGTTNAVGAVDVSGTGQVAPAPGEPYPYNGQTSYGAPAVSGSYVFATNYRDLNTTTNDGELVEWTVDAVTGTLTRTNNILPLKQPGDPVVTPNGKFLYVSQMYLNNGVENWEVVPIQVGAGGSLTVLTQNLQQTPSQSDTPMWMSPNGNFLYVGAALGQLWDYQIDQSTGALTLVQKYNISTSTLTIDPGVKYVFLSPEGANQVGTTTLTAYSVDPTTGALTPVAGATVDTKVIPISLAVVAPK